LVFKHPDFKRFSNTLASHDRDQPPTLPPQPPHTTTMSPVEDWNADEPPAVDPDYAVEPATEPEPELADVEEIEQDEVPKLLDEADEIGAMRPRMRKSATPGKKGAKEPAAWPDEDEHADENFEHTDEFKTADEDVDMEVDEKVTKTEIKSLAKECDEIGALKPRRIN